MKRVRWVLDPDQEQSGLPEHARCSGPHYLLGMPSAAGLSLLRTADRSTRADVLIGLQRSVGNTAVLGAVQRQTPPPKSSPASTVADDAPKDPGHQESAAVPSFRVLIVAHASPRWRRSHSDKDADAKNLELSRKRAERVRQLVEGQFAKEFPAGVSVNVDTEIATDRPQPGTIGVHAEARGSKDSLAAAKGNRTDDAQKHRRVDIFVTSERQISGSAGASQAGWYRSTDSRFWYVSISLVAGGSVGAAGSLIMLQLTNAATGYTVDGRVFAVGGGPKAALGVTGGVWSSPTSFSTDRKVNFEDFKDNWINFTTAGLNMFIGYDRSYISFTGLGSDAKLINVSGFNVGTVGIGASTVTGSLTLMGPLPPRKVWVEHSDETSVPYQRNERGEDSHSVLFGTQQFDVRDLETDLLESFLSSVAAARR